MGVRRSELPFEGKFVQVPNEWARDSRLSRKARGLLLEIMSHAVGWHVTLTGLVSAGKEGRDSVVTALGELREFGYLELMPQEHGVGGTFAVVEYQLRDPFTAPGFTAHGSTAPGQTAPGKSDAYKKTELKNTEVKNTGELPSLIADDEPERIISIDAAFDRFWSGWPRKKSRADARKAYGSAASRVPASQRVSWAQDVERGVIRSMAEWKREGRAVDKIPYAATWLRAEGWLDEPDPASGAEAARDAVPLWRSGHRVR